ncbi:hypothetical protein VN12_10100 [Pirellula sp. SH-Sr6A]|uniref:HdeD family acid-resistance protein n=1 Tax=Pirellula sp. SH-Sr6A TaxID=1632865 RepID=UPI00078C6C2A|nr:DUF308 domain-containing protein [Pirellula sp. SH-Sr6A]AMV32466.1 hypothetical protein VN12_10100 [Pirellula sp. SH-Sr6A]
MSEKQVLEGLLAERLELRLKSTLDAIWWTFLSRGLLAFGLAAAALLWPQQTIDVLIKVLGVTILIDGVAIAFGLFRSDDRRQLAIQAIVSLAIGSVLLFWSGITAKILLVFVGTWLVLQGIGLYFASRSMDAADGLRRLVSWVAVIKVLMGIVLVIWPNSGIVAISWLIGLAAIAIGLFMIFLATRIKRFSKRIANAGEQT